ncbi:hypothetical protein [Paludisphaera soli]|uniref:hypothetical protein n=1 Tax=Paludisphaera soli TaxID=2712865 RepID=UPI0013EB79C8|nr:hypothetical protein [Paludisphaera soli]
MADIDPTEITEQMRTFHAEDVAEQAAWMLHSRMWRTISARFYNLHSIDLRKHVKSIVKVKETINAGFDFVAVDAAKFADALQHGGFQPDSRERILGILPSVGSVAALATHGQGFRENSEPSLHCAVADDYCNVHLDNIGIRLGNYNANAPQHIADELIWQDKILPAMLKIGISPHFVDLLRRVHPVVPNLRQVTAVTKEWQPRVGVELDIARVRSKDASKQVRVYIDFSHACSNSTCKIFNNVQGRTYDDKSMIFTIEVTGL